jgi:hypothetical protein
MTLIRGRGLIADAGNMRVRFPMTPSFKMTFFETPP